MSTTEQFTGIIGIIMCFTTYFWNCIIIPIVLAIVCGRAFCVHMIIWYLPLIANGVQLDECMHVSSWSVLFHAMDISIA